MIYLIFEPPPNLPRLQRVATSLSKLALPQEWLTPGQTIECVQILPMHSTVPGWAGLGRRFAGGDGGSVERSNLGWWFGPTAQETPG